jgi:hypothetical protein
LTKLTPQAEQALRDLRAKDLEYRERKAKLELDLKQEMAERLRGIRKERDTALIVAAQSGVPRTQLGKAIGTTNYKTVQDILAESGPALVKNEMGWSLAKGFDSNQYSLRIDNLGHAKVTGTAIIEITDGEIQFVSGDEFVLAVIYREGLASEVIASA